MPVKSFLIATALALILVTPAAAACKPVKAETDLNGLRLGDADSARRLLGKRESLTSDKKIGANGAHNGSDILVVFNRDKSEMAVLTQYPGTSPGEFLAIEVRDGAATPYKSMVLSAEHLATERGVRLGVPRDFVIGLLGPCFAQSAKGRKTVLRYEIGDPQHPYLQRVNMPNYFAEYRFENGRLASFSIGSDNP
jgi:hypothetical protein